MYLLFSLSQILRITFPFFELEYSATCNFDFLQIHDGYSPSAYMLGKYCGTNAPLELFSSHNSLYFWFSSDHIINKGGFTVVWQSQAPGIAESVQLYIIHPSNHPSINKSITAYPVQGLQQSGA